MEVVIPTVYDLLSLTRRQISYLIFWRKYFADLGEHLELLQVARRRVESDVEEARRQGEEIMDEVQHWLDLVNRTIEEALELLDHARYEKTKLCGSPLLRRKLNREARKMRYHAAELLERRRFDRVGYRPQSHFSIFSVPSSDFEEFESRKPVMEGIMEAVKDPDIQVVGVGGMPGVGKTSLVTRIASQVYQYHLFDEVIMVAVTPTPYVRNIQTEMAEMLGLKFEEESEEGRAFRLFRRLKEKRVLIILDDVWEVFNREIIGIPSIDSHGGVKFLVVCRDQKVLHQMEAQKIFCIEPLLQNEAVSLFLKRSGITVDIQSQSANRYKNFVFDIVKKYAGLPLLLVEAANGLRYKGVQTLEDASKQLEQSDVDRYRTVFSTIEMSYNYMKNVVQRLMFLLCAALEEQLFLEHLLKLCLGLGLFNGHTVEEARWRMVHLISRLKDLYLLQDGETGNGLTMNKAIRQMALQIASKIASKEYNMLVLHDGLEDSKWPSEDLIRNFTALFLLGNHRGELPERLECPKLELFHVYDESQTLTIPDNLFEGVKGGLKVLSLTNMKLASLPSSIRVLTSIHTLCLDNCELDDIALLGDLVSLKVLSLAGSNIKQLPCQVRLLVRLRLLDLSNCSKLETIPPNVLKCLEGLQELLFPNSYDQWQYYHESEVERTNASLDEFNHLNDLEVLDIHIPDVKVVPGDFMWHKLVRYNIIIGQEQGGWSSKFARKLQLNLDSADMAVYHLIKPMVSNSEELWLKEMKGSKNIHEFDPEGFQELKHLHIQDLAEMEYIVNSEYSNSFPKLELLVLNNLMQLKGIYKYSNLGVIEGGEKEDEVSGVQADNVIELSELRDLTLQNLPKFIGFMSKEITGEASPNSSILFDEKVVFPNLEKLKLHGLGQLIVICQYNGLSLQGLTSLALFKCDNLMYLFTSTAAQALAHLQELIIKECRSVKEIVVANSEIDTNNKIVLPKVNTLIFENLAELYSFCCDGCTVEWPSLKKVTVSKCSKLKQFALGILHKSNFEVEVKDCTWHKERDPRSSIKYLFVLSDPSRTQIILDIESTEMLKIHERQHAPSYYSKLTKLSARNCDGTLNDFLSKLLRRSYELEHLEIKKCDLLRQVFNLEKLDADESGNGKYFALLKTIKLKDLPMLKCIWNRDPTGILGLHSLEEMEIVSCGFLKTIIPTSLAQHLRQLKELKIHSCPTVEGVAMNSEVETGTKNIELPELQTLELVLLPKFKMLCRENCHFQFPSMQSLTIQHCPTVGAFTSGFLCAQTLPVSNVNSNKLPLEVTDAYQKMKILKLEGLDNIEDIWQGSFSSKSFSELKEIELNSLAKLKYVIPSHMLPKLKDLEKLTVKNCDSLIEVLHCREPVFPRPSMLVLINLPKLLHVVKLESVGSKIFENLQSLQVKRCDSLQNLVFPSACLLKLRKLEISECNVMKEIDAMRGSEIREKILFSRLESVILEKLPMLSTFFRETAEFLSMREISIISCPELKTFSSGCYVKESPAPAGDHLFTNKAAYPKVQNLKLQGLDSIGDIWQGSFSSGSFSELKELEVATFAKLKYVISTNMFLMLSNLMKLTIENCDSLTEVFRLNEQFEFVSSVFPKPSTLVLISLPKLLHIVDSRGSKIFENLQSLQVKRCDSLQSLAFPSSCLQKLRKLEISECKILKGINVTEGGSGIEEKIVFSKLESVVLEKLPKLSTFFRETSEFPSMVNISIISCPELKTFSSGYYVKENLAASNHFFVNKDSFVKLQKLHLTNLEYCQKIWDGSMSPESLCELQVLELGQISTLLNIIPSSLLKRMQKLEEFSVQGCKALELVFDIDEDNCLNEELLPQLKELVLTDLPQMLLWRREPGIPVFKCLISLEFVRCSSLKRLFSISLAKNLEQLELLKLLSCEEMEHVLEGETGTTEVMEFKKLKHLILKHLPKLSSFCEEHCDFKWPQLEMVRVKHIPEMKTFAKGTQETPKLQEFYVSYISNCWRGDLNETVKYLHNNPGGPKHMVAPKKQLKCKLCFAAEREV